MPNGQKTQEIPAPPPAENPDIVSQPIDSPQEMVSRFANGKMRGDEGGPSAPVATLGGHTCATDRRGFLALGGYAVLGALASANAWSLEGPASSAVALLPDAWRKCAGQVALRYLSANPAFIDRRVLLARLRWPASPMTAAELGDHFQRLRHEDFARERTVVVDGWVLAQSEADLCALVSLRT